ncbi:SIR2 family protein [Sinobacterium norvegicum]|uniref:SIR2 family protein n=1 Tax=Sinobacterium norvegicum TaxID=1641715 RepID=UPI001F1E8152|nr:SIR2 family protein [Sinobacterium norvegicum]
MRSHQESYIKYEQERDTLFVFGAGASIAEGAPLQRDILKLIFESKDEHINSSNAASKVRLFINENFDISDGEYPTLESIFGYLEYFISKREGLGKEYTTLRITEIKEALIQLVHYVISKPAGNRNGTYRKFWEVVSETNRNVSVVTMNYDTLLDESFDFLYPDKAYIDYCIELMNYHHYDDISAFDWWVNPREPVPVWDGGDPKPIKLIKLHGSLNWKYCNCCNQVLLTAWDTKIDLGSMGFKGYIHASCENPETVEFDLSCPLDGNSFDTFIVPPSHIKDLSHPAINKLLDETAIEIRKAKKIVFVGYSFPEADVHIKALFRKNLRNDTELHVIDPYLNDSIRSNYKSLSAQPVFYEKSFEQFVAEDLVSLIESPNKSKHSDAASCAGV